MTRLFGLGCTNLSYKELYPMKLYKSPDIVLYYKYDPLLACWLLASFNMQPIVNYNGKAYNLLQNNCMNIA